MIARDGQVIPWGQSRVYIKYHKPVGVTTTSESHVPRNIIREIGHPERIFPIGRLDKDSSGLILLTNDGDIVNEILRTEFGHEREYEVTVDRPFDQALSGSSLGGSRHPGKQDQALSRGTLRAKTVQDRVDGRTEIDRFDECARQLGYRVLTLHRVRIMHITLAGLPAGTWKPLSPREQQELLTAVRRNH